MSSPDITDIERAAVATVLEGTSLSLGPNLERFEREFADYVGASHAVAVSSGTDALHLSLLALGIGEGDVVITTPFSFVASANVILFAGAIPEFVDVDPSTGNIDLERAAAKIHELRSEGRRPSAVLPVHIFGVPVDIPRFVENVRAEGVHVVEDACEAVGSRLRGRHAGTAGDVGTFAFYPNKQMTTGEGGMVICHSEEIALRVRTLRNQGRHPKDAWLQHSSLGYNCRLDEMSAALGVAQLSRIEHLVASRARVANWYREALTGTPGVDLPTAPSDARVSWFCFVIRIDGTIGRDHVAAELGRRGIPTRPYFPPIHLQPVYRERFGYEPGSFPVAEELGQVSLALPFSGVMTEEQVGEVARTLKEVVEA